MHVSDDTGRIAMLEERTVGTDPSPAELTRYIYSNHLQSASLELDEDAEIISYEEYHPYGTTSYQANNASINAVAKRYRYTGKERDEESGLYYHGARYYIPWLARWTSCDPLESKYAGMSPYNYCENNCVIRNDQNGASWETASDKVIADNTLKELGARKISLEKEQKSINEKIELAKNNQYKGGLLGKKLKTFESESSKNDFISKNDSKLNELKFMIKNIEDSINEINEMHESKDMIFSFKNLGTQGHGKLSTERRPNGDIITIINYTYGVKANSNSHSSTGNTIDTKGMYSNLIHELAHAYRFMKGSKTKTFYQTESQIGTDWFTYGTLYPKSFKDSMEVEAYQRQYAFSPEYFKKPDLAKGLEEVKEIFDIDTEWLYKVKDPISGQLLYED